MTNQDQQIEDARNRIRDRKDPVSQALAGVLNSGLEWYTEFHYDPWTYEDGRPMSPDRMFRMTQWGRAILDLADAINSGEYE